MTQCEQPQQPGTVELEKTSDSGQRDWTDPMYQTNEFKMYCWKVVLCTIQEEHDHSECPFAHPGENNVRRDPRIYKYRPEACPATQSKNGKCAVGVHCHLAHNVFERWLHPQRFRTQMCRDGADCTRKHTCFFAHTEQELRVVPDLGLTTNSSSSSSATIPPPPACPSPSAKRTSSINSGSSSMGAFTLPGSPAALSRSSSSSSRASSTAAMSPLSCGSRQHSFPAGQSPPQLFGQQQLNALSGAGYTAQAKSSKQWGLQRGLSGTMPGYQAGISGPFIGSQAAVASQVQAATVAAHLQQQLEQLQLQMLLQQQQQAALLQPDLATFLGQQVAANMQQAAQACAAAKAAEDQLTMLRAALGNTAAAAQLPFTLQPGVPMPRAAPGDVFSFSPPVQAASSTLPYNSSASSSFTPVLGFNTVSSPLAASPVGVTSSTLQQDDMLLALMLAQQQQQVHGIPQATHVPTASASSVQCGFQPLGCVDNNHQQVSQLAAMVAATAATHVPATAVGQLGVQPAASLFA